ncbi:MAG: L-histidine N(alpha)-methyltransferase [Candidatus Nomurabacteria bacterium]|nr:MAG: L-histidine N(alpha)-methyltransferase [Candidatus Nomurabacteria bacterium]
MQKKYLATINLSKLGFRYFRIMLESKAFSRKFIQAMVDHPNTGYIFEGKGWSGKKKVLGLGIWATSNSEIVDISNHIRAMIPKSYKIAYQSELTRLEFFTEIEGKKRQLVLLDELDYKLKLSPHELDYLKLISIDPALEVDVMARLLNVIPEKVTEIESKLKRENVYYGLTENRQLPKGYTKFFVDTTSLSIVEVDEYAALLKNDNKCVYLARGNGKYNFEFEYIVTDKKQFKKKYGTLLEISKSVLFHNNIYSNLFPQSKFVNTKIVQEEFIKLAKQNSEYFDLRNSELWYVSHDGAQSYLDIYSERDYESVMKTGEVSLFSDLAKNLIKDNKKFNIIDLGSGDGVKGKTFIETLGEEKVKSYFPVDIQELELSRTMKSHEDAKYSIHPTVLRFENLASRFPVGAKTDEINIYAIFGGTYGNFKREDINRYLSSIIRTDKDKLIVAIPIRGNLSEKDILATYLNKTTEHVAFSVLRQIGFDKKDFAKNIVNQGYILQQRFEDDSVVLYFTLAKDVRILGFTIEAGTRFDIVTSWKPTLADFKSALEKSFSVDKIVSNKTFALAVCSKK